MEKKLSISTALVTIHMIQVDGKKMTKAVFNQIQHESPFTWEGETYYDQILGFIHASEWEDFVIWTRAGELRKTSMIDMNEFLSWGHKGKKFSANNWQLSHCQEFIDQLNSWLEDDSYDLDVLKEFIGQVVNTAYKRQLYIAI